jgi:hypothetical protein
MDPGNGEAKAREQSRVEESLWHIWKGELWKRQAKVLTDFLVNKSDGGLVPRTWQPEDVHFDHLPSRSG